MMFREPQALGDNLVWGRWSATDCDNSYARNELHAKGRHGV